MAFILHGRDEVILFHIQNVSLLSSKGAEIQCRCDIHYILDLKVRIESCDCHMIWISPFFVCLFVCLFLQTRQMHGVDVEGTVVILDEAHNIVSIGCGG